MSKSLFDKLYGATDETIKLMKKPLVEKRLKRKFQSAWDDAETKRLELEQGIEEARRKFESYDINVILEYNRRLKRVMEVKREVEEEYSAYFGEDLV